MAFGPIIPPAGSGGGGSGFAPVTITGTTDSIDESDAADLDIALPAGVTDFFVMGARLTRTAGASALAGVALYQTDARSDAASHVFGDSFSGVDMPGPVKGPLNTTGGNSSRAGICIQSDGEFARLVVYNRDFSSPGTFQVELDILPHSGA